MEENKEQHQLGKIEVIKTLSDQQDAIREIAISPDLPVERPYNDEKTNGEMFYLNNLGLKVDFTGVKIPPRPQMERNLVYLFVEKWLKLEKILAMNKTECIIRINPSINLEAISSPYIPTKAYMIWAFNDLRPDLRIMNQRNSNGRRIMTVEERVLLGIRRFQTVSDGENKYLDLELPTLTSSYTEGKGEPKALVVRYQNGGMFIDVQDRNTPGGAREVFGIE